MLKGQECSSGSFFRDRIDETEERICVASDSVLGNRDRLRRVATGTVGLGLSRREIPNWMADSIFGYEGVIQWPGGRPFPVPDTLIDDAFNNDGSFRWLSDFMRFAEVPPRQKPQARVLQRLRLLDLAFWIDKPDIARHFDP
ncbi:hypothetical protein [Rhodospirillum sp. A1_3_36]|uniref:hypothetical protein n=1 Tax=Rhodospirillum sp. A1_3_36 TaxID=3391666 RepID=UPI0039A72265